MLERVEAGGEGVEGRLGGLAPPAVELRRQRMLVHGAPKKGRQQRLAAGPAADRLRPPGWAQQRKLEKGCRAGPDGEVPKLGRLDSESAETTASSRRPNPSVSLAASVADGVRMALQRSTGIPSVGGSTR